MFSLFRGFYGAFGFFIAFGEGKGNTSIAIFPFSRFGFCAKSCNVRRVFFRHARVHVHFVHELPLLSIFFATRSFLSAPYEGVFFRGSTHGHSLLNEYFRPWGKAHLSHHRFPLRGGTFCLFEGLRGPRRVHRVKATLASGIYRLFLYGVVFASRPLVNGSFLGEVRVFALRVFGRNGFHYFLVTMVTSGDECFRGPHRLNHSWAALTNGGFVSTIFFSCGGQLSSTIFLSKFHRDVWEFQLGFAPQLPFVKGGGKGKGAFNVLFFRRFFPRRLSRSFSRSFNLERIWSPRNAAFCVLPPP